MMIARISRVVAAAVLVLTAFVASPRQTGAAGIHMWERGERMPAFMHFTGTVIEPSNRDFVTLQNDDGGIVNFVMSDNTFVAEGTVIETGAVITGFYDASLPVIMIYPPQFGAVAFAAHSGEPPFIKFDRFDENLLSYDGELKLNVSDDRRIILQDGEEFLLFGQTPEEALANRAMMVFYSITTRSIPPQTSPELIVVFYERAEHPILIPPPQEPDFGRAELPLPAGTMVPLVVEGFPVGEIGLQYLPDGTVMVPLHIVANALGVELSWDGGSRSVKWGRLVSFRIGEDDYLFETRQARISIGAAPMLFNDRTYVPLQFFRDVVGMNNAFFFEGQIEINNFERME